MNIKGVLSLVLVISLLSTGVEAKRILFYEVGSSQANTIEGDFSKFSDELVKKNYEVASIQKGELTKDKLENYDILVVQDLNKQLTTGEISAIIWFVLQKNRGLFIDGGGQGSANQLTIPFGVTVDNGLLIDTTDMIPALKNRNSFTLDRFDEDPSTTILRQGVSKVGFYKDSGLFLSGSSKCVARGNTDTYSDTGSFAAGSIPCVAAASVFGQGQVFTISNADMLSNKYLNDYNNKNFGLNIIDWLGMVTDNVSVQATCDEVYIQIKEMRLENDRIKSQVKLLNDDKTNLNGQYNTANMQLTECQQKYDDLQSKTYFGLSMSNWAIIVLGVFILLAAIVYSRKKSTEVRIKDEDILNELGYELDSSKQPGTGQGPETGKPA
jgi:hypothetical protein